MIKGSMYQACEIDIATHLSLAAPAQIQILDRMDNGRSGAEVYLVELPKGSPYSGVYFLKLDKRPMRKNTADVPFPCAPVVESFSLADYYCQITTPANFDARSAKTWRQLQCDLSRLEDIILKHLTVCQIPPHFLGDHSVSPNEIINRMLDGKLAEDRSLAIFLRKKFCRNPTSFSSYSFNGDVLPNPYLFAVSSDIWHGYPFINDAYCPNHGDMHGENLMLSGCTGEYCLIDLENYTDRGWPFYDTAYFELAELLNKNVLTPMGSWHDDIVNLAKGNFAWLDFAGSRMSRHIHDAETKWINQVVKENFSQKTLLNDARLLARVMVGLNFSGKREINEIIREKSFLYASIFLRSMFKENMEWQKAPVAWNSDPQDPNLIAEAKKLAAWAGNFDRLSRYILVCGPGCCDNVATGEMLARIPWSLVVSFEADPGSNKLFEAISQRTVLGKLYPRNARHSMELAQANWLFANGYIGEFVAANPADWNRRCYDYVSTTIKEAANDSRLDTPIAIIDVDTMKRTSFLEDIIKIFARAGIEDMALISTEPMDTEDDILGYSYDGITCFNMGLNELASWCIDYMPDTIRTGFAVPCSVEPGMIMLTEEQCASIGGNAAIICDAMLDMEKDETDIYGFYYGRPVNWRTIAAQEPISRQEVETYAKEISARENECLVRRIDMVHQPGAGASIICRTLCWRFRHKMPTLEILHINNVLGEGLRQISSLSGLPLLLLADGNFTTSELDTLTGMLQILHIPAIIIHTMRTYDRQNAEKVLGPLTLEDAHKFFTAYSGRLKDSSYDASEKGRRIKSLRALSENADMALLRLPFFYGMFAFEEDFESIESYIANAIKNIGNNTNFLNLLKYVAILTVYTRNMGIPLRAAAKIGDFDKGKRQSTRSIMNHIYKLCGSLIINVQDGLRISHPYLAQCIIEAVSKTAWDFTQICLDMLDDLDKAADSLPSTQVEEIAKCLFIDRNEKDEEARFSPLITNIDSFDCQKQIFEALIQHFPENAHFHHHYGRLLSYHDPEDIDASEYFDKAVELAPEDALCLHGRGNMYLRRIKQKLKINYGLDEIYNRFHNLAEYAYNDFKKALDLASRANPSDRLDYKYPALSILDLTTVILGALKRAAGNDKFHELFTLPVSPVAKWAVEMQRQANLMEMEITDYHNNFYNDQFCTQMRSRLAQLKFTSVELESIIIQRPHDISSKAAYLNSFDLDFPPSQDQLSNVIKWGVDVIREGQAGPGLLWRWFKAGLLTNYGLDRQQELIEAVFDPNKNIMAAFLLYAIYFAKFMGGEESCASPALKYMSTARGLANYHPARYSSKLFYTGKGQLSAVKNNGITVECRVKGEVTQRQNGTLYIKTDNRFQVFFVPHHWGMNIGQSFDRCLNCILGLSFSGLRAEQ